MTNFKEILKECTYKTSRSGGAGGQHINKVETKVEILWKPAETGLLSQEQQELLLEKWSSKLDSEGYIHFTSQESRSQLKNKGFAQNKLLAAITLALKKEKKRKVSKVPKGVKEKRLQVKRVKSETKQNRKKVQW